MSTDGHSLMDFVEGLCINEDKSRMISSNIGSLNGLNNFLYYVIQSNEDHAKLDQVGEFLGNNPFNTLGAIPQLPGTKNRRVPAAG